MFNRINRLLFIIIIISAYSCGSKPCVQIPIANFFKSPVKSNYHISPDGRYISYLLNTNKRKPNLVIRSLADGKERAVTNFTEYAVRDYFWTYGDQLIVTEGDRDNFELLAVDVATLQTHTLLKGSKLIFRVLNRKTNNPDMITCMLNKRDSSAIDVYRINTKTGEMKMYVKNPGNITEWIPDLDGRIRLAKASDGVNESILYRPSDADKFKAIIVNNFKNRVQPIAFTGNKTYFYALSNVNRDKTALVEINAANINEEKVIYSNPRADIEDVVYFKTKHQLEQVIWEEAKPQHHFLNPVIKAIYKNLSDQLPGNEIRIIDRDTSESHMIVSAYNDRNPGTYYLYTTATKKLVKLADLNADIHPSELCEMKPISFNASDGTLINGYLTLPQNVKPRNLPVVVIPHSDPWRRNVWGFSSDVQFLANRGYAVFQVNYRGSIGYGKAFFSAGFKQVGGKMQDDITDGVKWLIDQKIANPRKIAIYGAGFGGFSALFGASFHPGLYNCVAVQNGLINLFTYVRDIPPFYKAMLSMRYEMVGNPETDADQFRAISPVFNTDKIKAPLLFVQTPRDPHANMSELYQFITELKKRGVPVTFINKAADRSKDRRKTPGQGRAEMNREHGKVQMYTELEKFLATNLQGKK